MLHCKVQVLTDLEVETHWLHESKKHENIIMTENDI